MVDLWQGSKTEARGKYAGAHISQEVKALCNVILQMGDEQPDGTYSCSYIWTII